MCHGALQKLVEGSELQTGPLEVESADDFLRATALRHRWVACTLCPTCAVGASLTAVPSLVSMHSCSGAQALHQHAQLVGLGKPGLL